MNLFIFISLFLTLVAGVAAVTASYHVLMTKRDPRSALAWVAFCLVLPIIGPSVYLIFGAARHPLSPTVHGWRVRHQQGPAVVQ